MVEKSNKLIDSDLILSLKKKFSDLNNEISKVIVGQEDVIRQIMVSILSRGHCLLIGVPGLAKTLIVKSLADLMDLKFSRIQFYLI